MQDPSSENIVALDVGVPVWERCFTIAPLVLIGTREKTGDIDLAPKHMVTPMGWQNYFGFVCTPSHGTYQNIKRTGVFTVSYPRPSQFLFASLAASPRCEDDKKPVLRSFSTFAARQIDGAFIEDGYLFFECEHFKTVDGFGKNSLITGRIVAAYAHKEALRTSEWDDEELIRKAPLFAYLSPGRFANIDKSQSFPYPTDMRK